MLLIKGAKMGTRLLAFSILVLSTSLVCAGEGRLSDRALSRLGLQALKPMSDRDGLRIRGMSTSVGGFSLSTASSKSRQSTASISYSGSGSITAVGVAATQAG